MDAIDTRTVTDRRRLRFSTLADLRRDVELLAGAERGGGLRSTGNWTLGQTLGHLATWIHFPYDGFPLRPPWFIKLFLKGRRARYLNDGMPAGVRIPGVPGGTLGTEPLTLEVGLARLHAALDRLEREEPIHPSPLFGPLSREDWVKAALRHSELHLSFHHPRA